MQILVFRCNLITLEIKMNLKKKMKLLLLLTFVLVSNPVLAADDGILKLKQKLSQMFPNEVPFKVAKTPVPGLYEVDFGDSFMYITGDAEYAVKGDIIHMLTNVNLTDKKRAESRLQTMTAITDKNTIIYPAKNKILTMTVFTDIDCSYCRKLHSDMEGYNKLGIEVRYAFYPRAGLGSNSYKKAVSVWCAGDQNKALDDAKAGRRIEIKDCENPVKSHMETADKLGVNSTPTLVFEDGTIIPGYIPPARLIDVLKQRNIIQ